MELGREFEFVFEDGGVPGVFLPKRIVVRGVLSARALKRFLIQAADLDDLQKHELLQRAFERRFRINGEMARRIELRPSDITASIAAERVTPRPA